MTLAKEEALCKVLKSPPPPGSPFGVPIPGSERPNRSAVYRHWRFRDSPLLETLDPKVTTFHDLFEKALSERANKPVLGRREWIVASQSWDSKYTWMTYAEVAERRKNLGAGIAELHHRAGVREDKYGVGLWAQNSPEWQITELALVSQSLWPVSLYETFGLEASEYILNHSQLACVVTSLPHIPVLIQLAPRVPTLKVIISLDPLDAGEQAGHSKHAVLGKLAKDAGVQLYSMAEVEALGASCGRSMRPPHRDDIITVNYTSGTTGSPKGVVITHRNAVAGITSARGNDAAYRTDVHISYLPLAHIYGRMVDQTAISAGAKVGYFHGDVVGLVDDMKILAPTGLYSVPRLYNRFQSAIAAATIQADGVKGALSRRAIATKRASMKLPPGQATNKHMLYDSIWTPKVRQAVGVHKARALISGSAQLDPEVQEFLRAAFGIKFVQGWGMTETYAVGTCQFEGDWSVGNIGAPSVGAEICIESVPDLDYNVTDKPFPRGEMLIRGPVVFREYYKNPEETAKTIEADGWFHTGDIIEIDNMGKIRIIDRKKNVLKLSQGEYISPERIENIYMANSPVIGTAYVHGDPKESTLVAILGVDPEPFAAFAGKILKKTIAPTEVAALKAAGQDARVKQAVLKQMDAIAVKSKLNGYERVRNVFLDVEPFTVDNELLTPTLKLKRPQTAKAFRSHIDTMYAEINAQPSAKPKL